MRLVSTPLTAVAALYSGCSCRKYAMKASNACIGLKLVHAVVHDHLGWVMGLMGFDGEGRVGAAECHFRQQVEMRNTWSIFWDEHCSKF